MQHESLWIVILVLFGITFFECLTRSLKAGKKLPKATYLTIAVICAIVVIESVMRLAGYWINIQYVQNISTILMRVVQWGLGIVGLLMILSIALKRPNKSTA